MRLSILEATGGSVLSGVHQAIKSSDVTAINLLTSISSKFTELVEKRNVTIPTKHIIQGGPKPTQICKIMHLIHRYLSYWSGYISFITGCHGFVLLLRLKIED